MKQFGQLIGFKQENLAKYKKFHGEIWPKISGAIKNAGIKNYSIFHHQGKLFGHYEYTGPLKKLINEKPSYFMKKTALLGLLIVFASHESLQSRQRSEDIDVRPGKGDFMPSIVDSKNGKLEGLVENGLHVFRGIPYAAPPVGKLRFQAPQPPANWPTGW